MINTPNIQVILLAAGSSRRMGAENKLLLPYQERSLLTEVIYQLAATNINGITLVTGHDRLAIEAAVASYDLQLCFNPRHQKGQSSSIQAGVQQLPETADGFLIALGDMPKITSTHYQVLIDDFRELLLQEGKAILRPVRDGQPGHPVCFAASYQQAILAAEEEDGCRSVILQNRSQLRKWETEEAVYFLDVDTPEEYRSSL